MHNTDFVVDGYEHLELSTQVFIREALAWGIDIDVLDADKNIIQLTQGDHHEYIQQATKTRLDSYITVEMMGDKSVSKMMLERAQVGTPAGQKYTDQAVALGAYETYKTGLWVVKPLSTNYGIGITLLPENPPKQAYVAAITNAFLHDESILVEAFIPGIECRFLVIGGECRGVIQRMPAHIIGDGVHCVQHLVEMKNQHPYRGKGHKTPLEKIEMGATETSVLAQANLTWDSIPEEGQQVLLRTNSNISTGGDSLDYTDQVHMTYKRIAEAAAASVGATICGVDIIMEAHTATADAQNHAVIELNYNPVLYFHAFPFQGTSRPVVAPILGLLGFEKQVE